MHSNVTRELNSIKKELNDIIDNYSDKIIDPCKSRKLREVIQKNVLDTIAQTVENIDLIFDDIYGEEYQKNPTYE